MRSVVVTVIVATLAAWLLDTSHGGVSGKSVVATAGH